jgi:hypothetical protein
MDWKTPEFWIAVSLAILVKVRTSRKQGLLENAISVVVALGSAYVFADWVSELTGASEAVAAALVALSAQNLMNWIINASHNPTDLLRAWWGKGK